ncbi:carbohydrate kinase family protein [Jatrophihabitans sp. DSM 45814]
MDISAARVLVAGDANPDLVLRGDVRPRFGQAEQLLADASILIGGSAAITGHGFARLGRPVSIVAAIGRDLYGAQVCDELARAGVDVRPIIERTGVATGLTVVLSDGGDRAILTYPGAMPTLTAAEVAAVAADLSDLAHVHFASYFLMPSLAAELPNLLAALRKRGLTTSLDTNADPANEWVGLATALPHLDVLLPNRSEVSALGGDRNPHVAAARLAASGPLVVVKNGADGATAVDRAGNTTVVSAMPVTTVDTTGAGDTFDAAFLDGWLNGLSLPECLERAALAGAFCVAAVGGTAGQPTRDDLIPDKIPREHR